METVNILLLGYGRNDLIFADMFRKRKLYKDSVYRIIRIQLLDKTEEFCLRNCIRLADSGILYTYYFRRLCLTCNV